MDERLVHFEEYLSQLRSISYLMHRRDLLDLWVDRLLPGTPYITQSKLLEMPMPSHASWRWGTIITQLRYLLAREQLIRQTWHAGKYRGEDNPERFTLKTDSGRSKLDFEGLTRTIKSDKFWAYSRMVHALHCITDGCRSWCEGCACHEMFASFQEEDSIEFALLSQEAAKSFPHAPSIRDLDGPDAACVMKGKRAWQMASGVFDGVVHNHMVSAHDNLLKTIQSLSGWQRIACMTGIAYNV